jgi:hypothetical protein
MNYFPKKIASRTLYYGIASIIVMMLYSCSSSKDDVSGVTIGTTNGISGVIVDVDSNLMSAVMVYLVRSEMWANAVHPNNIVLIDSAITNDSGYFAFENYDLDGYSIFVQNGGEAVLVSSDNLKPDANVQSQIQLEKAATIAVNILDDGSPETVFLAGTAYSQHTSDAYSEWSLPGVLPGTYLLGAKDQTDSGLIFSYLDIVKINQNEFNYDYTYSYHPGEVLLENFESNNLPLSSLYSPYRLFWENN